MEFPVIPATGDRVVFGYYDSKQVLYNQSSYDASEYDKTIEPERRLFNKYFGSDLVYQELREARGLAYSAYSRYESPQRKNDSYCFLAYIGTQNDKVRQAVETFDQIIENMPEAETNFILAKEMVLSQFATTRYPGESIFNKWMAAEDLGLEENPDRAIYEKFKDLTMEDLKAFHDRYVKNRHYTYTILGNSKEVDMEFVKGLGTLEMPSQEEYFGY